MELDGVLVCLGVVVQAENGMIKMQSKKGRTLCEFFIGWLALYSGKPLNDWIFHILRNAYLLGNTYIGGWKFAEREIPYKDGYE